MARTRKKLQCSVTRWQGPQRVPRLTDYTALLLSGLYTTRLSDETYRVTEKEQLCVPTHHSYLLLTSFFFLPPFLVTTSSSLTSSTTSTTYPPPDSSQQLVAIYALPILTHSTSHALLHTCTLSILLSPHSVAYSLPTTYVLALT